jgi:hypothetical protein
MLGSEVVWVSLPSGSQEKSSCIPKEICQKSRNNLKINCQAILLKIERKE